MKLREFRDFMGRHPGRTLGLILPDGRRIPSDFHVTEVGHVVKKFIDCGGTVRSLESCVLQVWLASNDKEHRLTAGRLAAIMDLATPLLPSPDINVEFEYEDAVITQYSVSSFAAVGGELHFALEHKHTDCLAREACGLDASCCGTPLGQ